MARPKKPESEKKKERLTVYLTKGEAEKLNMLSKSFQLEKTKIITKALDYYLKSLENPPEQLSQSKITSLMDSDTERVNGYVCSKGHSFWVEFEWPHIPQACPACGSSELNKTWIGTVTKGF